LKNIPQARWAWSPTIVGASAPRGKKFLSLEQKYSGSERQSAGKYSLGKDFLIKITPNYSK